MCPFGYTPHSHSVLVAQSFSLVDQAFIFCQEYSNTKFVTRDGAKQALCNPLLNKREGWTKHDEYIDASSTGLSYTN